MKRSMLPDSLLDPISWFQKMQRESPVCFDSEFIAFGGCKGSWHVFRHQDVADVFRDHNTFSSGYMPDVPGDYFGKNLSFTDPPKHDKLHKVISKAFLPSVIAQMEPWINEICNELITPILNKEETDFAKDFADPLPIIVIMKMFGIVSEQFDKVNELVGRITTNPALGGDLEGFIKMQEELKHLFLGVIEEHRRFPRHNLTDTLLKANIDGQPLSEDELLSFCFALLVAGSETTSGFLGNAMRVLIDYPDIQQHLIEKPQDIPLMLNEVLRFRSPVFSIQRVATCDVRFKGNLIRKGDFITVWMGATNFDDSVFADPGVFDMNRKKLNEVLIFGTGIHRCLGEMLSKLEARIALEHVFRHLCDIRMKPGAVLSLYPSTVVNRLVSLPITFNKSC